jgi:UDP-glucuronate decarboxylase
MLDLAEAVLTATGSNSTIEHRELPKDDPTRRCPNIDKARQSLGWEPQVDLQAGLAKTVEYYREQLNNPS